jgi:hypothetical protein
VGKFAGLNSVRQGEDNAEALTPLSAKNPSPHPRPELSNSGHLPFRPLNIYCSSAGLTERRRNDPSRRARVVAGGNWSDDFDPHGGVGRRIHRSRVPEIHVSESPESISNHLIDIRSQYALA